MSSEHHTTCWREHDPCLRVFLGQLLEATYPFATASWVGLGNGREGVIVSSEDHWRLRQLYQQATGVK